MPRFKTIAFFTEDTPYEKEAKELIKTAKKFGIDVEIIPYPNTGEWVKNAALKSVFISSMLAKYPKIEWFLYVDIDARFRQYPKLFDTFEGDIGVHYRRGKELLSGTIFLRNTEAVRILIRKWIDLQNQNPRVWDQKTLDKVLRGNHNLTIVDLPPAYTQIFDSMAEYGKPIIEHMQASRRYRKTISKGGPDAIPEIIGKIRIRRGYDGTYYIPRQNKQAEEYLDKHCTRIDNQLKWFPQTHAEKEIQSLQKHFYRKTCYIVGKGPSLDYLREEHFPDLEAPIVSLNEAIHTVEKLNLPNPIFCLQQDAKLRDTCYPKRSKLFVSVKAANWYAGRDRVFIFDSRRYGLNLNCLSVSATIKIVQALGTNKIILVCFDACINGNLQYAKAIGYDATWGGDLERFLSHHGKIEKQLAKTPAMWIIPKASA